MTLRDQLPSLRRIPPAHRDAGVWPEGTRVTEAGDLEVDGVSLMAAIEQRGTPILVGDEAALRARCRGYRDLPPDADVAIAAGALLPTALPRHMREHGLTLTTRSADEVRTAKELGFPTARMVLLSRTGSVEDHKAAGYYGVGRIVVRSAAEVEQATTHVDAAQGVLLGVTADTAQHPGRPAGADTEAALRRLAAHSHLRLDGLYCHVPAAPARPTRRDTLRTLVGLLAAIRRHRGARPDHLHLRDDLLPWCPERLAEVDAYGPVCRLHAALRSACATLGVPVPRVTLDPGPAATARLVVHACRVVAVEKSGTSATVVIDAETARPGGAARLIGRTTTAPVRPTDIVGCRTARDAGPRLRVPLPESIRPGDHLALAWPTATDVGSDGRSAG